MKIKRLPYRLTVAKYPRLPLCPEGFFTLSRGEEEISLVCETNNLPKGYVAREDGWRAFSVEGSLDFSLVGILAKISAALADQNIPLFAISTYDTDCILVKEQNFEAATAALKQKRYTVL